MQFGFVGGCGEGAVKASEERFADEGRRPGGNLGRRECGGRCEMEKWKRAKRQ